MFLMRRKILSMAFEGSTNSNVKRQKGSEKPKSSHYNYSDSSLFSGSKETVQLCSSHSNFSDISEAEN